jgi:hypothetical protein
VAIVNLKRKESRLLHKIYKRYKAIIHEESRPLHKIYTHYKAILQRSIYLLKVDSTWNLFSSYTCTILINKLFISSCMLSLFIICIFLIKIYLLLFNALSHQSEPRYNFHLISIPIYCTLMFLIQENICSEISAP